jgi:hypothetical protein
MTLQSRAEQSRAEQSRAEQSRAEQSRAEQSRAEHISEMIFKMKYTFQNLISANAQCFYDDLHFFKLVPLISFVNNFI